MSMTISVKVKPNAKKESVEQLPDGSFLISVKAPAAEGRANARLVKVLASYFGIAPSCVAIISGISSRTKRVEILAE